MEKQHENPLDPLPRDPNTTPTADESVSKAEEKSRQQRAQGNETQGIP